MNGTVRSNRFRFLAALLSILLTLALCGCAFTNAELQETTLPSETTLPAETTSPPEHIQYPPPIFIYPTETEPPVTEPNSPAPVTDEVLVKLMDMLYVLDETAGPVQTLPDGYYYIGTGYALFDRFPKWNFEANNIPTDTEFYASMENPDYVYYLGEDGYHRMLRAALSEAHKGISGAAAPVPEDTTLAFFNTLLENTDTPYHQSMDNVFYSPYAVDLYNLFYKGFNEWEQRKVPLTEEEKAFLYANGWDDGYARPISNAKRFPISAMDAQLKRFFGISYAESYKTGIDRHSHFLESTQCFYTWRSDTRAFWFEIQSLQETAPGTFQITYLCEGYPSTRYRMTLKAGDGVFLIQSNVRV